MIDYRLIFIIVAPVTIHAPAVAEHLLLPRTAKKEQVAIRSKINAIDCYVLNTLEEIRLHCPQDSTPWVILYVSDDVRQLSIAVTDGVIVVVVK